MANMDKSLVVDLLYAQGTAIAAKALNTDAINTSLNRMPEEVRALLTEILRETFATGYVVGTFDGGKMALKGRELKAQQDAAANKDE